MKLRNLFQLVLIASVVTFIAPSCVKEGPVGPAGANGTNGTNGTDGTATCISCHQGDSGKKMEQKKAEFFMSEHSLGAIAVDYAGGRVGCSQCHSNEGFVEYATLGVANTVVNKPSAWECSTCHGIHSTFAANDYALRLVAPVKSNIDATYMFDFKNNSNLCVNCHQARTAEPNKVTPGVATFKITSIHYGPHHGPQGNLVAGVGFAEISGSLSYPAPGSSKHYTPACVGCHMATTTNKQGGHTLIPSLAACNTCHGVTEKDYDHKGVQTTDSTDLVVLRNKLVSLGALIATPDVTNPALFTYAPKVATIPMLQAQAIYNYVGIKEDRSYGVHNPDYVRALLKNTIDALNKLP